MKTSRNLAPAPDGVGARPRRRKRSRARTLALGGLVVVLLLALVPAVSLVRAVTAPGTDSSAAKAAEWARGHHLGFAVTLAEELAYRLNPPKTGGTPDPALLEPTDPAPSTTAVPPVAAARGYHATARAPMATVVTPALPGEGVFRTKASSSRGPAVQLAYVRPDPVHTSYLAAVMVLDPRLVRFVQHPGYAEPGQLSAWNQRDTIPASKRAGLVATFNSGFKLADAKGGYYADGNTAGRLRTGAASVVVDRHGGLDVGSWGSEVTMSANVVSVRQNLRLLIDHGVVASNVAANLQTSWGATVKDADYVWRSGIGVDARGDVVQVVGPSLSAPTLAGVLLHAGAVRAMELDINQNWISTMWYSAAKGGGDPTPHKVLPFLRPADRYFTDSSRDFVAAYLR